MPYIKLIYKGIEVDARPVRDNVGISAKNGTIKLWKSIYPLHKFKNCTILTEVDDIITKTEYGYDFLTMEDARKISEMEANLKNIIYNSKNE